MKWTSELTKSEHYAAAQGEYDEQTLAFMEALGDHLESDEHYIDFSPASHLHPDQVWLGLALMLSVWDGEGLWEGFSQIERHCVAFYLKAQMEAQAEWAAAQTHKGEADEALDLDN